MFQEVILKPRTIRESNLVLIVVFLSFLLLILFGILIGSTSFKKTFVDVPWTDALSSVSALIAAGATIGAVLVAKTALATWKIQFKTVEAYNATIDLEKSIDRFLFSYVVYYNSTMWSEIKKSRCVVFNNEITEQIAIHDLNEQKWEASKVQLINSFRWACTFWSENECDELNNFTDLVIGLMDEELLSIKVKMERLNSFPIPYDMDSDNGVNKALSYIKSILHLKRNITRYSR